MSLQSASDPVGHVETVHTPVTLCSQVLYPRARELATNWLPVRRRVQHAHEPLFPQACVRHDHKRTPLLTEPGMWMLHTGDQ